MCTRKGCVLLGVQSSGTDTFLSSTIVLFLLRSAGKLKSLQAFFKFSKEKKRKLSLFAGKSQCQFGLDQRRLVVSVALSVEPDDIVVWLFGFGLSGRWGRSLISCCCRSVLGAGPTYLRCRPVRHTWTQSCRHSLLINWPQTFTGLSSPVFCSAAIRKLSLVLFLSFYPNNFVLFTQFFFLHSFFVPFHHIAY